MPAIRVTRDPNDPLFPHGENKGYTRGCPCDSCADAHRRRVKQARYERACGRPRRVRVDAALVEHLRALLRCPSVTASGVARAAEPGSGRSAESLEVAVGLIVKGQARFITYAARAALLAVDADQAVSGVTVDAARTEQMLRSLNAHGYPLRDLAKRLGYDSLGSIRGPLGAGHRVTTATFDKVAALYRELENTPGPSTRSATLARRKGWHPPACYDDTGTLIPGAARDTEPVVDVERRDRDRIETLVLTGDGWTRQRIIDVRRIPERTVASARAEAGVRLEAVPSGMPRGMMRGRSEWRLTANSQAVITLARKAWLRVQCGADPSEEWDALVAAAQLMAGRDTTGVAA